MVRTQGTQRVAGKDVEARCASRSTVVNISPEGPKTSSVEPDNPYDVVQFVRVLLTRFSRFEIEMPDHHAFVLKDFACTDSGHGSLLLPV